MIAADTLLFDLDGTLIDARADIVNAMNHTLARLGYDEKPFADIVSYIGTGVSDLVAKSMGTRDAKLVGEGVRIYGEYYLKHPADRAKLYPNVVEVLEYFSKKRKFILTNRYAVFAAAVLKELGIAKYFEDIIGGDDEGCLKPMACVFDRFMPKLNIERASALIVGDMDVDIMAGKNSGIKTCWVTHGLGKAEDVRPLRPDYVIDDLLELKKIIR
ncbi:MAG: HAD-IA family hydrolase [Candidatus Omnitrophota bacterium]